MVSQVSGIILMQINLEGRQQTSNPPAEDGYEKEDSFNL